MRRLSTLLMVAILLLLVAAVPSLAQGGSILEIASSTDDLSTLVAAVEAADPSVAETLGGAGPFTVFAPTNAAFSKLLSTLELDADALLAETDLLTQVLLYHVAEGAVTSDQLSEGQLIPTLQGAQIEVTFNEAGNPVLNGVAEVVTADIEASNGVVHVIEDVILPGSVLVELGLDSTTEEAAAEAPEAEATEAPAEEEAEAEATEEAAEEDMAMMEGGSAYVRVAHLSPNAGAVNVLVNGETFLEGVEYPTVSEWTEVESGTFQASIESDTASLGPLDVTVEPGQFVTLAAVGSIGEAEDGSDTTLTVVPVVEDYSRIASGNARVTVFHGIEGAPQVDVLAAGSVLVDALAFPGTFVDAEGVGNDGAATVDVAAGTYDLQVIANDNPDLVLIDAPGTELLENTNYFIAAIGRPEEPDVLVVPTDQAQFTPETTMEGSAFIRVAHLSPDAGAVTVTVDGEEAFIRLRYPLVTGWREVAPGTHDIAVLSGGSPVIGPLTVDLADGSYTTIAAVGSVGNASLSGQLIPESFADLDSANGRVTVFHAIESGTELAVDVLADGAPIVEDLAFPGTFPLPAGGFNDGTATLDVPAGTYAVQVVPADTTNAILEAPEFAVEGGLGYLVIAAGTPDAPQLIVIPSNPATIGLDPLEAALLEQGEGDMEMTEEDAEAAEEEATEESAEDAEAEEEATEEPTEEETEEEDAA